MITRLHDQAEGDPDRDRDQRGDGERRQRLPGQAGGAGDVAQVGDGGDDRQEDQRRDDRAQAASRNVPPTVLRVSVSQLGSTSPVVASTPSAPMLRARSPSTTPRTSPIRTWTPNEGSRRPVGRSLGKRSIHSEKVTVRSLRPVEPDAGRDAVDFSRRCARVVRGRSPVRARSIARRRVSRSPTVAGIIEGSGAPHGQPTPGRCRFRGSGHTSGHA